MPVGQAKTLLMVKFDCVGAPAAKAMIGRRCKGKGSCRIVDDTEVGTVSDGTTQRIGVASFWARILGKFS